LRRGLIREQTLDRIEREAALRAESAIINDLLAAIRTVHRASQKDGLLNGIRFDYAKQVKKFTLYVEETTGIK
jgi:hypothetical protein